MHADKITKWTIMNNYVHMDKIANYVDIITCTDMD